jgi:hypothetical protein
MVQVRFDCRRPPDPSAAPQAQNQNHPGPLIAAEMQSQPRVSAVSRVWQSYEIAKRKGGTPCPLKLCAQ